MGCWWTVVWVGAPEVEHGKGIVIWLYRTWLMGMC